MKPSAALATHRAAIRDLVARHHARNPRLFGSAARGDDHNASDLDILIDPLPEMTLFDIGALIADLESLLGIPVDILTPGALPPAMSGAILKDLQPL